MKIWSLVVLCAAVYAKHEVYEGWRSYYVLPKSHEELKSLGSIHGDYELDFLTKPYIDRPGVVLVKPAYQEGFTNKLDELAIEYTVHSYDVKNALEYDDVVFEQRRSESKARNGGKLAYDAYQEWPVIEQYLIDIAEKYPETVTLVTAGESFEGRKLLYLKISTTNFEDTTKPIMFIDGGIHAREWISPPTVTWAIHKLVEDVTEPDLLENYDWILFPVVNPDGYQYTFTHERFWRKTRSTDQHNNSINCPGVDGNRNYDFFWNTVGSSSNPCTDTYAGNRPFSEVETRAVRDIIFKYVDRMPYYVTMHSYGSMILYPWGHDGTISNDGFIHHSSAIAQGAAINAAANPDFPQYAVGNSVLIVGYPASGASEDWAHLNGVPLSFTYELPGLSRGMQGFNLDPMWIEQVCKETWEGLKAGARSSRQLYWNKRL